MFFKGDPLSPYLFILALEILAQGCALRKISGIPSSSLAFYLRCPGLQVGRPSTSDEEVFSPHTNFTGLLITKLGNFSFWVQQKRACCPMKPIKFSCHSDLQQEMSNATELLGVDKTRNMEHPGTFRNIPEHSETPRNMKKLKYFFMKNS